MTTYIQFQDRQLCLDWEDGEPLLTTLNGTEFYNADLIAELKQTAIAAQSAEHEGVNANG